MRRNRPLSMIAAAAAIAIAAAPAAEARSAVGAPLEMPIVVRGNGSNWAGPGTVETVTFADSRAAPVRVVRGGLGLSAAALAADRQLPGPQKRQTTGEMLVAFADPLARPVTVLRGIAYETPDLGLFAPAGGRALDRIAFAVDGAESSHGTDPGMWRPDLAGPQGPMQVSAAAAADIGGGDRFDLGENRTLGRAYLAHLYRRYGNWPDAISAYNWGPGNLDAWIEEGRPPGGLPLEVEQYRARVLHDGGLDVPPVAAAAKQ